MQLSKGRKRGRCAAALPADQWVDNALCCFKLGASAGCSPPYGWLRKSCFSRRHTEAPAFAGASLFNRCSSCPTQPPATMSGAQSRAHSRLVNAKRFKGLGRSQLDPPLSARQTQKGRPQGGPFAFVWRMGWVVRSPAGVRRFCRSRTGQPQAGPGAQRASGSGAGMHPTIPLSSPDK